MTNPVHQPTVLLKHTQGGQTHHDWMISRVNQDLLWTARVDPPSEQWRTLATFELTEISPHRRDYLTYEGPISGNRGEVQRIDKGTVVADEWTDQRIRLRVAMRHFSGRIELRRIDEQKWVASVPV